MRLRRQFTWTLVMVDLEFLSHCSHQHSGHSFSRNQFWLCWWVMQVILSGGFNQAPPRKNDLPSIDGECAPISGCWWSKSPEHLWGGVVESSSSVGPELFLHWSMSITWRHESMEVHDSAGSSQLQLLALFQCFTKHSPGFTSHSPWNSSKMHPGLYDINWYNSITSITYHDISDSSWTSISRVEIWRGVSGFAGARSGWSRLELCFAARCRENSHGFSSPRSCQGADNP